MATPDMVAWWARPRGEATARWIANYQGSVDSRQRTAIVEAVRNLGAETVFEVGCHCGPNLIRLARDLPGVSCLGLDASREAVEAGRRWAREVGLTDRVQLNIGTLPGSVEALPTGSADVVVSCYCLAYLDERDIDQVLFELGRLSTTAVILVEPWPAPGLTGRRELSGYCEWRHAYLDRQPWIGTLRDRTVTTIPIQPPVDALDRVVVFAA